MRRAPILMYHWFRPEGVVSASRSPALEIEPALFERQIRFLSESGYRAVTLKEIVSPEKDSASPGMPVAITFDDGTLDFWEFAKPVLERYGFTATLFIVAGFVGKESTWDRHIGEPSRRLMSWEQLLELQHEGFEIGSHTSTHRSITELSDEQVWSELTESRRTIADNIGVAPDFLAYPRGRYDAKHKRLAREAGYLGACAVVLRWRDLLRADRYEMKRMTIKGTESMLRFRLRLRLGRWIPFAETEPA